MQYFLRKSGQDDAVTCVSRLDGVTSGALVVARGGMDSASANFLLAQFAGRLVSKTYHCLCSGSPLGASCSKSLARAPIRAGTGGFSKSCVADGGQVSLTSV